MFDNQSRFMKIVIVVSMLLFILIGWSAHAQPPPIWGNLTPGPHAIGFRTVEKYDSSRTYGEKYDYFGSPVEGETARMIQICIWYPAEVSESPVHMVYGEYAYPFPEDNHFVDFLSVMQGREIGILHYFLSNNTAAVQDMMNLEFMATRDAPPEPGTFPLIIYHPGNQGAYCQNAVLCEYLASWGFVIATTHAVGNSGPNPAMDYADLETSVRDREFVMAYMRASHQGAPAKVGVLGYAFGGLSALIHQMRNTDIDAVAGLHGTFVNPDYVQFSLQAPFFDRNRMRVPFLHICTGDSEAVDLALLDSLSASDRYAIRFPAAQPTDLTLYGTIPAFASDSASRSLERTRIHYEMTCRYVRDFFAGCLQGDTAGFATLRGSPEDHLAESGLSLTSFAPAEPLPPTAEQFGDIVRQRGTDVALELCAKFGLDSPEHPILSGPAFTNLGYQFLQRGDIDQALVLFKMGVNAYPGSANAWDSYGEACMAHGDYEMALKNYRKALEILPSDSTINPQLREAISNGIPATIERLEQLIAEQEGSNQ